MDDGVHQARPADVAATACVVTKPVCSLRDVKEADIGPDRLACFAHLEAMHFWLKKTERYPQKKTGNTTSINTAQQSKTQ
jgi:hypothetical protein